MKAHVAGCLAALLAFAPAAAEAMQCSIGTIAGVAFGAYDIFDSSPLDSVGSITFRCDDVGMSDSLRIWIGAGSSGSYLPRTLLQGQYALSYNLYRDPARLTIWGDGSSGTGEYGPTVPPNGTDVTVNVYGRIPAGQSAHVGSYSDVVVVTIVY